MAVPFSSLLNSSSLSEMCSNFGFPFSSANSSSAILRKAASNSFLPQQASASSSPPVLRVERRFFNSVASRRDGVEEPTLHPQDRGTTAGRCLLRQEGVRRRLSQDGG